jgi:hypothetical protein
MEIPFSKYIAVSYSKGIPIVDALPQYKIYFRELLTNIINYVEEGQK